jgi:phosphatidylglycerophosphate synthase
MFDKALLKITKPIVDGIAKYLARRDVGADQLTFIGLGFGMLAALLIAFSNPLLAIVPIVLGRMCDGLDGAVARMTSTQTDRGAFLDIALDFVFYASVPLAFAIANPIHNALAGAVLLAAFVSTGTSFLAYATLAAKRGETSSDYPTKGIYYLGGLTEGSETIALFLACCIWPTQFPVLAYIYASLCALTTVTRLVTGWERFR